VIIKEDTHEDKENTSGKWNGTCISVCIRSGTSGEEVRLCRAMQRVSSAGFRERREPSVFGAAVRPDDTQPAMRPGSRTDACNASKREKLQ
jgi:hypothetical protein